MLIVPNPHALLIPPCTCGLAEKSGFRRRRQDPLHPPAWAMGCSPRTGRMVAGEATTTTIPALCQLTFPSSECARASSHVRSTMHAACRFDAASAFNSDPCYARSRRLKRIKLMEDGGWSLWRNTPSPPPGSRTR